MGSKQNFRKLVRTRVRLTRTEDAQLFSGRLIKMSLTDAHLKLEPKDSVMPGQTFMVEVHGPDIKVVYAARVESVDEEKAVFQVGTDIRYLPISEPVRILVEDFEVHVKWDKNEIVGHLYDISREGLAMVIMDDIRPGTPVDLTIHRKMHRYDVRGSVRYCIEMNDGLGHCRLGVKIIQEDRITNGRWNALFDRILDAA